jgi:hypothetical protein
MKRVGDHQKNFDLDLNFGIKGEQFILGVMNGSVKVEVKTDRETHRTGNIVVEFECNGKPSGISTTEADYWAFVIDGNALALLVEVGRLKKIARYFYKKNGYKSGGDNNMSKMVLIPFKEINNKYNYETGLY